MTRNPILKVLLTFKNSGVRSLLIGGQACIIYGAAEFSRDADFAVLASSANLARIKNALSDMDAENIYVPPLEKKYLDKGHACHFRCREESVKGIRIDILSRMRGCDDFDVLWEKRFTVKPEGGKPVDVIGLEDLVRSKKTQRDKDWFMIDRLVQNDIMLINNPSGSKIRWRLLECRRADSLNGLVKKHPLIAQKCIRQRPLIEYAIEENINSLQPALESEEEAEREKDRQYWAPLRKELESLRSREAKKRRAAKKAD